VRGAPYRNRGGTSRGTPETGCMVGPTGLGAVGSSIGLTSTNSETFILIIRDD
jgi:hypothetical protein